MLWMWNITLFTALAPLYRRYFSYIYIFYFPSLQSCQWRKRPAKILIFNLDMTLDIGTYNCPCENTSSSNETSRIVTNDIQNSCIHTIVRTLVPVMHGPLYVALSEATSILNNKILAIFAIENMVKKGNKKWYRYKKYRL